jgi:hypothetical protein
MGKSTAGSKREEERAERGQRVLSRRKFVVDEATIMWKDSRLPLSRLHAN